MRRLFALLLVLPLCGMILPGGTGTPTVVPGAGATLHRTFSNAPTNVTTPNPSFWTIGYAFAPGDVPTGNRITTALLGGVSVPVACTARTFYTNGDLRWCQMMVDFSNKTIPPGSTFDFVPQVSAGAWNDTTTRTNANWIALNDVLTFSGITTTGVVDATTTGAGDWTCAFDGGATNSIETYGSSPLGLMVHVAAQCTNAGNTHRNIYAAMSYWVTQKSDGTMGPIASHGPAIKNTKLHPSNAALSTIAQFEFAADFTRGGVSQRAYGVKANALGVQPMHRPDGQWDWTANDPGIWVGAWGSTQTVRTLYETTQMVPLRTSLGTSSYPGPGGYQGAFGNQPSAIITAVDTTTELVTVNSRSNISLGLQGGIQITMQRPAAVQMFTSGTLPGGANNTSVYWANSQVQLASRTCAAGVVTAVTTTGKLPFPNATTFTASVVGGSGAGYSVTNATMTVTNQATGTFTYPAASCSGASSGAPQLELQTNRVLFYDTAANARTFGTTGKINLTSAGSCVTTAGSCWTQNAVAPGSPGQWNQAANPTGAQTFLTVFPEHVIQYYAGNTEMHQRNARQNTINYAPFPVAGNDADISSTIPYTLRVPSLLPPADTPAGMDSYTTIGYGLSAEFSSNINGGINPLSIATDTTNGWASDNAHAVNPYYMVWLSEGTPFLRDMAFLYSNGIGAKMALSNRNFEIEGTTYYFNSACSVTAGATRAGAWGERSKILALPALPDSGPGKSVQTYMINAIQSSIDGCNHYHTYSGASAVGMTAYFEFDKPPETSYLVNGWLQSAQIAYKYVSWAVGDLLLHDWIPDIRDITTFHSTYIMGVYDNPGVVCPTFAPSYTHSIIKNYSGVQGSSPATYISTFADLGYGFGFAAVANVSSASPAVLTYTGVTRMGALANLQRIRLVNYISNDVNLANPPHTAYFPANAGEGWISGDTYFIRNLSGTTFNLSKTAGGALLNNTGPAGNVNFFWMWDAALNTCPATIQPGSGGTGTTAGVAEDLAAMAILVNLGLVTQTAWDNADALNPISWLTGATWAWSPTAVP